MLLTILQGGSIETILIHLLLILPIVLLALSVHESAHGYAAYLLGDPTARNLGRLTLNPLKHLHPIGFLCMLLLGYGWAKPVPINTRYFKNPKYGMAITAAAGPLSNFLMGAIGAFFFGFFGKLQSHLINEGTIAVSSFVLTLVRLTTFFFLYLSLLNFMLMAFNLIPLPPFDGSRIVLAFLPTRVYFSVMKYERQIMMAVLLGSLLLSNLTDFSPSSLVTEILTSLISIPGSLLADLIF